MNIQEVSKYEERLFLVTECGQPCEPSHHEVKALIKIYKELNPDDKFCETCFGQVSQRIHQLATEYYKLKTEVNAKPKQTKKTKDSDRL